MRLLMMLIFFFQAEDGIRDGRVTGVQTCALLLVLQGEQSVVEFSPGTPDGSGFNVLFADFDLMVCLLIRWAHCKTSSYALSALSATCSQVNFSSTLCLPAAPIFSATS